MQSTGMSGNELPSQRWSSGIRPLPSGHEGGRRRADQALVPVRGAGIRIFLSTASWRAITPGGVLTPDVLVFAPDFYDHFDMHRLFTPLPTMAFSLHRWPDG